MQFPIAGSLSSVFAHVVKAPKNMQNIQMTSAKHLPNLFFSDSRVRGCSDWGFINLLKTKMNLSATQYLRGKQGFIAQEID